jgi:hypothetical protein
VADGRLAAPDHDLVEELWTVERALDRGIAAAPVDRGEGVNDRMPRIDVRHGSQDRGAREGIVAGHLHQRDALG